MTSVSGIVHLFYSYEKAFFAIGILSKKKSQVHTWLKYFLEGVD